MAIDWKKVFFGTGAVAGIVGAIFGGKYMYNLYRLSQNLKVDLKGMIYKASINGVIIRIIPTIRNTTNATAQLSNLMVDVSYKDSMLASSKKVTEEFAIPKNDAKPMPAIDLEINLVKALTTAPGLVKEYRSTGKVTLTVTTNVDIDGWYGYEDKQEFTFGSNNLSGAESSELRKSLLLNDLRNNWG